MEDPNPLRGKLINTHTKINTDVIRDKLLNNNLFLQQCKIIAEQGWQYNFNVIADLAIFTPSTDPIENYFMRVCLFKLIAQLSLENNNTQNSVWFQRTRINLEGELNRLITNRNIAAGNLPSFVIPAKWTSMVGCVMSATFFKAFARQYAPSAWEPLAERLLSYLALLMLVSYMGFLLLEVTHPHRAPTAHDVAHELSRQQALKDLMENSQIKELVLVSDDDLKKLGVEKSGPQFN